MQLAKIGAAALCALGLAACGSSPRTTTQLLACGSIYNGNGAYTEYGAWSDRDHRRQRRRPHFRSRRGDRRRGRRVLGNQVAAGRGNTVATIGAAVAGAAVATRSSAVRTAGFSPIASTSHG